MYSAGQDLHVAGLACYIKPIAIIVVIVVVAVVVIITVIVMYLDFLLSHV